MSEQRRSSSDLGSLMSMLRPRSTLQRVLVTPILLIAVLAVGGYAFATFSADEQFKAAREGFTSTWNSRDTLVLKAGEGGGGVCEITPAQGDPRTIRASAGFDRTVVRPWFDGDADLRCSRFTKVWTGWNADLAAVALAPWAFFIVAPLLGILVAVYLLSGPKPEKR